MKSDRIIMVATDLSARSDRPVERAFLLADQLQASILVLHVPESDTRLRPHEEQRLRDLIRNDFGFTEANAKVIFEYGSVPSTIARVAEERHCEIVITGVARFNEFRDYVLGTAVDYLVRHSSVPVLVVKQRARKPYRRIFIGTDFSECSRQAVLAVAAPFAEADLRLVHAYHPPYEAFLSRDSTVDFVREEAEREMRKFVEALPIAVRQRLETVVLEGENVAATIERAIRDWSAELLVIGRHGRSGVAQATVGSQAAVLLTCEPTDILIVREARGAPPSIDRNAGQEQPE